MEGTAAGSITDIDGNFLIEASTGVAELIEKAELYRATATDYASYSKYTDEIMPKAVYLKVTLKKEWKTADDETMKYYVYVAKNNGSTSDKTNEVWVSGTYENTDYEYVTLIGPTTLTRLNCGKFAKARTALLYSTSLTKHSSPLKCTPKSPCTSTCPPLTTKPSLAKWTLKLTASTNSTTKTLLLQNRRLVIVPTMTPWYHTPSKMATGKVDAEYVENYAIAHTNTKLTASYSKPNSWATTFWLPKRSMKK